MCCPAILTSDSCNFHPFLLFAWLNAMAQATSMILRIFGFSHTFFKNKTLILSSHIRHFNDNFQLNFFKMWIKCISTHYHNNFLYICYSNVFFLFYSYNIMQSIYTYACDGYCIYRFADRRHFDQIIHWRQKHHSPKLQYTLKRHFLYVRERTTHTHRLRTKRWKRAILSSDRKSTRIVCIATRLVPGEKRPLECL